jgi:hypothetical protein
MGWKAFGIDMGASEVMVMRNESSPHATGAWIEASVKNSARGYGGKCGGKSSRVLGGRGSV